VEKAETAARWASELPVLEGTQLVIKSEPRVIRCLEVLEVTENIQSAQDEARGRIRSFLWTAAWTLWRWEPLWCRAPRQADRSPLTWPLAFEAPWIGTSGRRFGEPVEPALGETQSRGRRHGLR